MDLIFGAGARQTVCNFLQAPVIASVWRVNLCKRRLDEARAFRCPANGRQAKAAGLDLGAVDARKIRTLVVNIAVENGHVAFFVFVDDVHIGAGCAAHARVVNAHSLHAVVANDADDAIIALTTLTRPHMDIVFEFLQAF